MRILSVRTASLCAVATLFAVSGGCTSLSDIHPLVPEGSKADVSLGSRGSAAFDISLAPDGSGDVVGASPVHLEFARWSQAFAETTSGVYYLGGAAAGFASAYRDVKGTWKTELSGTVNQNVNGYVYNEHDVNGYIFNEHEVRFPGN